MPLQICSLLIKVKLIQSKELKCLRFIGDTLFNSMLESLPFLVISLLFFPLGLLHGCMFISVNPTPKMAGGYAETPSEFEIFARGEYPMILEQPFEEESKA